jgi:hypothetical protein
MLLAHFVDQPQHQPRFGEFTADPAMSGWSVLSERQRHTLLSHPHGSPLPSIKNPAFGIISPQLNELFQEALRPQTESS